MTSGMAIHKKWLQTYFSTPSSLTHSAYPFWSDALFKRGRTKADKVDIDLTHSSLAPGLICPDGRYRQIVTVEDAVRGGCNLFDIDQLRMEYSPDEYQNLLICEFVGDLASVLPLSAAPPPPVATVRPMKPAAAKKPAMPISLGQRCTRCLTNCCRAKPPIPAILWRFLDGQE